MSNNSEAISDISVHSQDRIRCYNINNWKKQNCVYILWTYTCSYTQTEKDSKVLVNCEYFKVTGLDIISFLPFPSIR